MSAQPDHPQEKPGGLRSLVITAMFAAFISIVVFVVGTFFFVIPRQVDHERRLQRLEGRVTDLEHEAQRAPSPVATVAPAALPASAPGSAAAAVRKP